MNEGAVEGLTASKAKTHNDLFLERLKHGNEVFSAFKVHKMGKQVAERLIAPDGSLRSFEEWKSSVKGITSHYTDAWLRTEYDTAVIRAHQAADWQEYEANRDVLPNLRWMPTTSPLPDGEHRVFWESRLCLPVDDPFWSRHRPGDRWNCKCSLEPTDDPVVRLDPKDEGEAAPAQRGLENNPKNGQLFSDKHPYFPSNCAACPFYTEASGVRNAIRRMFTSRQKDCHNCPYIDRKLIETKLAEQYPLDQWEHTYISESGGYVVTELQRIKEGKQNSAERAVFKKEMDICKVSADHGHKIAYLSSTDRKKGETYDILFDGVPAELKSFSGGGALIKQMKHALTEQGAKMVVVRLENREVLNKLIEARRKLKGRILYYYMGEDILIELK